MKIVKKLLIALLAGIALLALVGLFLPDRVHVERSIVIDAPQSTLFTLVNGYHSFNRWSPWFPRDPNARYTLEGPLSGVGAKQTWVSDKAEVGSGSQEVTVSEPYKHVGSRVEFTGQGGADSTIDLEAAEGGTKVTWGMDFVFGYNLVARYMGLSFDSMIGPDYEKGLAQLKTLAESLPKTDFAGLTVERVKLEPLDIAYVSTASSTDGAAIGAAMGKGFEQVMAYIQQHGLDLAGAPLCISDNLEPEGDTYRFDAAFPIKPAAEPVAPTAPAASTARPEGGQVASPVQVGKTPGGSHLKVVYQGPYEEMAATYDKIKAYMAAQGIESRDRMWEQYMNDPDATPKEELLTHIYVPIAD